MLLGRKLAEPLGRAGKLDLANGFGILLQGHNRRRVSANLKVFLVFVQLSSNDFFRRHRLAAAVSEVGCSHLLQIVDIIDEATFASLIAGSTFRGTAMSMKNIGLLRRRSMNAWP